MWKISIIILGLCAVVLLNLCIKTYWEIENEKIQLDKFRIIHEACQGPGKFTDKDTIDCRE